MAKKAWRQSSVILFAPSLSQARHMVQDNFSDCPASLCFETGTKPPETIGDFMVSFFGVIIIRRLNIRTTQSGQKSNRSKLSGALIYIGTLLWFCIVSDWSNRSLIFAGFQLSWSIWTWCVLKFHGMPGLWLNGSRSVINVMLCFLRLGGLTRLDSSLKTAITLSHLNSQRHETGSSLCGILVADLRAMFPQQTLDLSVVWQTALEDPSYSKCLLFIPCAYVLEQVLVYEACFVAFNY